MESRSCTDCFSNNVFVSCVIVLEKLCYIVTQHVLEEHVYVCV